MQENHSRYSAISIILHWVIVILLFVNVYVGGWMHEAMHGGEAGVFAQRLAVHKTIGISVLLLSVVRLGWRLAHPWPSLPEKTPTWQRVLARITHGAFYALMIGIPLLGWAAASAGDLPDVRVFGAVPWPTLPLPVDEGLAGLLEGLHTASVKVLYGLVALHVLGAAKHYLVDKDIVAIRMIPFLPKR